MSPPENNPKEPTTSLPEIHNPKQGPPGDWTWMCVFDGGAEVTPLAVTPDLMQSWLIGDHHSKPIFTNDQFAFARRGVRVMLGDMIGTVVCNGLTYGKTIIRVDEDEENALQQVANGELQLFEEKKQESEDGDDEL